ncbi:MAG: DUF4434 domain-containing protein [Clostridiales bacterium]|nr:DUF4434 domain-containing protein [Clostridiales bacterium]
MKKWRFGIVAAITLIGFIYISRPVRLSKPLQAANRANVFNSSFVQAWYAEKWNEDKWKEELSVLKCAGVEELIIQTTADTKHKRTNYPTDMAGYKYSGVDMLRNVLDAADFVGMKIRVGLGFSDDWWLKGASDKEWLLREAGYNKDIFNEIHNRYGKRKSLGGWYIPYEFYQLTAISVGHQSNLNAFLKEIGNEIKSKSDKDIMVSPFYITGYSWAMPLKKWTRMIEKSMKNTGIDILALQDGVGAKNASVKELDSLFKATKNGTDKLGIKLYGNVETFDCISGKNVPASRERISTQLLAQKPYVEKFIAFSLNHFQIREKEAQLNVFIEYLEEDLHSN